MLFADGFGKPVSARGLCPPVAPASAFKIPLALMGYDGGFSAVDEQLPACHFKAGDPDFLPEWKQTTTPSRWMTNSVIWYSQRLTEWLGGAPSTTWTASTTATGISKAAGQTARRSDPGLAQRQPAISPRAGPLPWQDGERQAAGLRQTLRIPPIASARHRRLADPRQRPAWVTPEAAGWQPRPGISRSGWFVGWASKQEQQLIFVHTVIRSLANSSPSLRAVGKRCVAALPAWKSL